MSEKLVKAIATVAGGLALGQIRFPDMDDEPEYLSTIRDHIDEFKLAIGGDEELTDLTEELRPAAHAFADLIADRITNYKQPSTAEKLKKLEVPVRLAVEQLVGRLCGQDPRRDGRWAPGPWKLKRLVDAQVRLSPSSMTRQELREGYDPLLHAIVDKIYDNRHALFR